MLDLAPPLTRILPQPTDLAEQDPNQKAIVFVLFGATGDLARRKVLPAFFQLAQHGLLPPSWRLIGNGRGDVSHEEFTAHVYDALTEFGPDPKDGPWDDFAANLRFAGGGFSKENPGTLLDQLAEAKHDLGDDIQQIHYLAVPPSTFITMTEGLGAHGLTDRSRVVYEKPFGTSPENFRELNAAVHKVLEESQVFRIDHFLGKEAVQNIHMLRFGNTIFGDVWSGRHIRAVQIDVPEALDITDRAGFYDETGALLDMVVTHLFQLAAEIALEPPASMEAEDIQDARNAVIGAFRPLSPEDVVYGQFEGYTDTEGIDPESKVDTFVAAKLWIDTERWRGVPFLLRTGKQLAESVQRISLIFEKPHEGPLHDETPQLGNVLAFDLSGDGAIGIRMVIKNPGAEFALATDVARLPLGDVADTVPLPAYVKLIRDSLTGDRALFTRPDGLAHAWEVIAPILANPPVVQRYSRGSWGPAAATELAGPDGWLLGDTEHVEGRSASPLSVLSANVRSVSI